MLKTAVSNMFHVPFCWHQHARRRFTVVSYTPPLRMGPKPREELRENTLTLQPPPTTTTHPGTSAMRDLEVTRSAAGQRCVISACWSLSRYDDCAKAAGVSGGVWTDSVPEADKALPAPPSSERSFVSPPFFSSFSSSSSCWCRCRCLLFSVFAQEGRGEQAEGC